MKRKQTRDRREQSSLIGIYDTALGDEMQNQHYKYNDY